jgi:putative membrane protein
MATGFLGGGADVALRQAIEQVERASAAEVVIAVRRRAGNWLHAHVIVGALTAFAGLGFMLWSEATFSLTSIWVDPFLVGALAGAAVRVMPGVQRALTPRRIRRRGVRRAALVAFHARGVRRTSARVGILVFIALTERMAAVIADDGVLKVVPADRWRVALGRIDRSVGAGGHATARAIAALAELLGPCLPCAADDVNELPDEVDEQAANADDDPDALDDLELTDDPEAAP